LAAGTVERGRAIGDQGAQDAVEEARASERGAHHDQRRAICEGRERSEQKAGTTARAELRRFAAARCMCRQLCYQRPRHVPGEVARLKEIVAEGLSQSAG
jgi:hypothetical protein